MYLDPQHWSVQITNQKALAVQRKADRSQLCRYSNVPVQQHTGTQRFFTAVHSMQPCFAAAFLTDPKFFDRIRNQNNICRFATKKPDKQHCCQDLLTRYNCGRKNFTYKNSLPNSTFQYHSPPTPFSINTSVSPCASSKTTEARKEVCYHLFI